MQISTLPLKIRFRKGFIEEADENELFHWKAEDFSVYQWADFSICCEVVLLSFYHEELAFKDFSIV